MISLVIWLFVETWRVVERERRLTGAVRHTMWKERRRYAIISTVFGLSYIGRFFINEYDSDACGKPIGSDFDYLMTLISVWLLEGLSMGVLMIFHLRNFKYGSLFSSRKKERPYASIKLREFDTDEVYSQGERNDSYEI